MTRITTYDSTLRDGEQALGVSLSVDDKLRICERLDDFGIDIIEGGFPSSNPKSAEFFSRVKELKLSHARIAAFGSTCRKGCAPADDAALAALLSCGTPIVALVGKTWDVHVTDCLQASLDENLRMIGESVKFVKGAGVEVVFDAEHFFDGFASNPAYALSCLVAAAENGVDSIDLCDTNGSALPHDIEIGVLAAKEAIATAVGREKTVRLGIHCHNDSGCAVANTLAAVQAGATQIQGTINGIGERSGNTNLCTAIADLELKMGHECVGAERLKKMTELARFVAETCNMVLPNNTPYVGAGAFAHKAGLHASAMTRLNGAYEHIEPQFVGNSSNLLVSELAGKASLIAKARSLGFDFAEDDAKVDQILATVKQREAQGYTYETANGSLALLIGSFMHEYAPYFQLESFRVIVDDYEDRGSFAKDANSEATIKIHVGESRFVATGEGVGPVGALDAALRIALGEFYPQVTDIELVDFKVRILDENVGCDAITRVGITARDGHGSWGTVGVSENILEASWNALVDSIDYGLRRAGVVPVVTTE